MWKAVEGGGDENDMRAFYFVWRDQKKLLSGALAHWVLGEGWNLLEFFKHTSDIFTFVPLCKWAVEYAGNLIYCLQILFIVLNGADLNLKSTQKQIIIIISQNSLNLP